MVVNSRSTCGSMRGCGFQLSWMARTHDRLAGMTGLFAVFIAFDLGTQRHADNEQNYRSRRERDRGGVQLLDRLLLGVDLMLSVVQPLLSLETFTLHVGSLAAEPPGVSSGSE